MHLLNVGAKKRKIADRSNQSRPKLQYSLSDATKKQNKNVPDDQLFINPSGPGPVATKRFKPNVFTQEPAGKTLVLKNSQADNKNNA